MSGYGSVRWQHVLALHMDDIQKPYIGDQTVFSVKLHLQANDNWLSKTTYIHLRYYVISSKQPKFKLMSDNPQYAEGTC